MRSLSVRLFLLSLLLALPSVAFAQNVTLSGSVQFSALDGSVDDQDHTVNGVFTVNGDLTVNGTVSCNDDSGRTSACAMAFNVGRDLTVNAGGALFAENRTGTGTGGAITLTVGRDLIVHGPSGNLAGAIISSSAQSSSSSTGGAINANVAGAATIENGATIDAGSSNALGGAISIVAGGHLDVSGNVLSGPSRTLLSTRLTDAALSGGTGNTIGGPITLRSTSFTEPGLTIGSNASIVSQGDTAGAGPVLVEGCGVVIKGLVAGLVRKDGAARVAIRSGKDITIDARDLGVTGATLGRNGRVRADAPSGSGINLKLDIFAAETIDILGPDGASSSLYTVTALPGASTAKSVGGTIRVISLSDVINASGNLIDDGRTASGDSGGDVFLYSKGNLNLDHANIAAIGDFNTGNTNRSGGTITARSYSGNVIWTNGTGEVRPTGSGSGLPASAQGQITLTACGTINISGSTFPTNGAPVGTWPSQTTGACSPAAPSLPAGEPSLPVCNTPPVANDGTATTNEDNCVTVTMTATDADGDPLTFSLVSGPSHGTLSAFFNQTPTSAQATYCPDANYNGSDSFVFKADDGKGGTSNGTITITINPVNDPPTFNLGANPVTSLEDAGPQMLPGYASSISPGPTADEAGQTVTFTVTNDNNALFSMQPAIAPNGTLTYTSAPNANGSANVVVVAHDSGGTANGGNDTSAPHNFNIVVTPVNDAPSFTKGADQTANEDAGPQTVANWATAISAGPADESGQTVTFTVTTNNPSLFSAGPAVASNGTLTYTSAPNANGSAIVTVTAHDNGGTANGGADTSAPQTFNITIVAVNDPPSFTGGGDVTVLEDSGSYSASWATAISAGPPDESGQTVAFTTTNNNNALFSAQPSVAPDGTLTFTPAANAYGSATVTVTAHDDGGIANGGNDASAPQTFTINITPVNDAPSFTPGGNVMVLEDSGAYSASWATSISAGPNEGSQTVHFNVSNDNHALFASQPTISASGVLNFTPAPNANGVATVTVNLQDDGGTANGGVDTSANVTFTINVVAVNDPPSFTKGADQTTLEDSGPQTVPGWATGISAGPADESGQTVTFSTTNNNNALFSVQPSVAPDGTLTYTPAADAFGSATVTVTAHDNGGTANGGSDTSAPQTFTITVTPVNDAPSFTKGPDVSANDNAGAVSFPGWATAISAGPANESGQTVHFVVTGNTHPEFFSVQPSVSATGTLSFTTSPSHSGVASITIVLMDNGGTANGGVDTSAPQSFNITINHVNNPPVANADRYDTIGNTTLEVGGAQSLTGSVFVTGSVLANDSDGGDGPGPLTASLNTATAGAIVTVNADGTFTYVPPAGFTGVDSFTYNVSDGSDTAVGTVSISVLSRVWYVKNNGGGTSGRSHDPFTSLSAAETASVAGDIIYVFNGDGTTTNQNNGFTAKANQRLLGSGVALDVPVSVNGGPNPTVLLAAGAASHIGNSGGNAVTVSNVSGVEVAGLDISASSSGVNAGTTGAASASVNVHDVTVSSATINGVRATASSSGILTVSVANSTITALGNGIDGRSTSGELRLGVNGTTVTSTGGNGVSVDGFSGGTSTVTSFSNNTISGNTTGSGFVVNTARFDAIPGGTFDVVNGGTLSIGSAGNGVGGSGLLFLNVSGDLSFGTLSVVNDTGAGVNVSGSGLFTGATGFRLSSSTGDITSGGSGILGSSATFGTILNSIVATDGSNGISLRSCSGSIAATTGSISGSSASGLELIGGSVNVTYGGSITEASASPVSVSVTSGGAISLTGAISGSGQGISITGAASTESFGGSLVMNTGANGAFNASGNSGAIAVTGSSNTLATSTGVALNVVNTPIAAAGLNFRSISANGAPNGIVLNNTGNSGSLSVTGTGVASSGGTIQNITNDGVLLTSTLSPSFNNMNIQSTAKSGVKGTSVVNFSFTNSTINNSGTGGGTDDSNIAFNTFTAGTENNLSGNVTITGNTLTNALYNGVHLRNGSGTIASANISNNTITSSTSAAASLGSGININLLGSAAAVGNLTAATIANNVITNFPSGAGIQAFGGNANAAGPSGTIGVAGNPSSLVSITGNRVAGASSVNRMGTNAILVNVSGKGSGNFDVSNNGTIANPLTNMVGAAIGAGVNGNATGTVTTNNNVIVANNTLASGGISGGTGITFTSADTPNMTWTINGNSISNTDGNGILAVARGATAQLTLKIQNNNVGASLSGVRQGIRVDAGNGSSINDKVCLNISGNTSAGSGGATGIGLRKQGTNAAVNVFAMNANVATSSPAVEAYVNALNPLGGGTTLLSATSGFSGCTNP